MVGQDPSDPKDNSEKKFEGTKVDLGEDLLESTNAGQSSTPSDPQQPRASPDAKGAPPAFDLKEEVQHAEILFAERLFDDAKKTLRRILRRNPGNERATKLLEEIQKIEIQELLGGEAPRKRLGAGDSGEDDSPAAVIERLEKDLLFNLEKSEISPIPDLFESQAAYERYRDRLVKAAGSMGPKDRMDVGVAHLEMGLFDTAQALFETVVRFDEHKIAGMYLLGLSLIYGGKAIEATIRLEPLCRDLTLAEGPKTDFLYLMGLAFEKLNDRRKAREFFRRVHMLNPRYRDVPEKVK